MAGLGWTASVNPGLMTPGSPTGSTDAGRALGGKQSKASPGGSRDKAHWGVPVLRSPTEARSATCYLCELEQVSSSPLASTSSSVMWG